MKLGIPALPFGYTRFLALWGARFAAASQTFEMEGALWLGGRSGHEPARALRPAATLLHARARAGRRGLVGDGPSI